MNYEEEINYRNMIMSRIRSGEKITREERLWLVTHRVVNWLYGYPHLNTDIINLCPNTDYLVRVKVEHLTYSKQIYPVFCVPGGKGKILTDYELIDLRGNISLGKPVKMLVCSVDSEREQTEFSYRSSLGLLGVAYQCDYFDDKQKLHMRQSSNTGFPLFAMLSEAMSDNQMLYRCKAPTNDNFESLVFSVEWIEKTKTLENPI